MSLLPFLAEWAARSSVLVLSAALLLRVLRVKAPSIRLAAWTATLAGSLAIPALTALLPNVPLSSAWLPVAGWTMNSATRPPADAPGIAFGAAPVRTGAVPGDGTAWRDSIVTAQEGEGSNRFDWTPGMGLIIVSAYIIGVAALLVRLLAGLAMSRRLLRRSRATGQTIDAIEIRQSDGVAGPVTLGIVRPVILLPDDWPSWDSATLQAVLAHEQSHVQRHDPALQLLSMLHRVILWFSPLSWFLHQRLVRAAEEASDDAALAAIGDRARYAEVLLGFLRAAGRLKAAPTLGMIAVPMARYGSPARRIERILDGTGLARGLTRWSAAGIVAAAVPLACVVAAAQARPAFEIANVHVSPPRGDGRAVMRMEGGDEVRGGRYEIYRATMVDLVSTAYGVDARAVVDGPSWLAVDRFDVIAKTADTTPQASVRLMLQALLADRFALVVRQDTRPMPAWVLSRGSGSPKLRRPGSPSGSGCQAVYEREQLSCRSVTMDEFIAWLRAGPNTSLPIVNATGIEGTWDFDIDGQPLSRTRGVSDGNPIIDGVDKQLGLKFERRDYPQPVFVVERVNRTPTPNAADVESRLPRDPVRFEVASVRPCESFDPRATGGEIGQRSSPGGQVVTGCLPLTLLIVQAWNLSPQVQASPGLVLSLGGPGLVEGAPPWLASKRFNIVAKAPIATGGLAQDPKYQAMLRNLLVERFKIASHFEDRPKAALALVTDRPKLTPRLTTADPSARSGCRSSGLVAAGSSEIVCQNVTMTQFVDALNQSFGIVAGGRRVVNETGLEGSWDLTLSYRIRPAAAGAPGAPPDPTGDVTLVEAVERQLRLKLERVTRPFPVFVLDHIEEQPIEN